jgi:hypothetical protein
VISHRNSFHLLVPLALRFTMLDANRWEEWYMRTILETSRQQMPERIDSARQAIARRLHDFEHNTDHHAERHEIESALRALSILEVKQKKGRHRRMLSLLWRDTRQLHRN